MFAPPTNFCGRTFCMQNTKNRRAHTNFDFLKTTKSFAMDFFKYFQGAPLYPGDLDHRLCNSNRPYLVRNRGRPTLLTGRNPPFSFRRGLCTTFPLYFFPTSSSPIFQSHRLPCRAPPPVAAGPRAKTRKISRLHVSFLTPMRLAPGATTLQGFWFATF